MNITLEEAKLDLYRTIIDIDLMQQIVKASSQLEDRNDCDQDYYRGITIRVSNHIVSGKRVLAKIQKVVNNPEKYGITHH